jgi:hypothetical protein
MNGVAAEIEFVSPTVHRKVGATSAVSACRSWRLTASRNAACIFFEGSVGLVKLFQDDLDFRVDNFLHRGRAGGRNGGDKARGDEPAQDRMGLCCVHLIDLIRSRSAS